MENNTVIRIQNWTRRFWGIIACFVFAPAVWAALTWTNRHPIAWLYTFTPATTEKAVWIPPGATIENRVGKPLEVKNIQMGFPLTVELASREAFSAVLPKATRSEVILTQAGDHSYNVDVNHIAYAPEHTYKHWERVWPPLTVTGKDGTFQREGDVATFGEGAMLVWSNSPTRGLAFFAFCLRALAIVAALVGAGYSPLLLIGLTAAFKPRGNAPPSAA
jgi:hypothetical protein